MNNTSCLIEEPPDVTNEWRHLFYTVILPIILVLGFLFNSFSLFATAKSSLNSVALSYLLSMITSNLLLMILAVPWLIYRSCDPNRCRPYSDAFYHAYIEPPFLNWMTTFSTYVLVCMSVERYVSVSHPGFFRRIHRLPTTRMIILSSLFFSFLIHIPLFLKHTVFCSECWLITLNVTVTSSTLWLAYVWILQLLSRFLPSGALIILNLTTIFKYRQIINKRSRMTTDAVSNTNTPNSSLNNLSTVHRNKKSNLAQSSQDEKRQLKILSGLVCLVAVCIVPAGVSALLSTTYRHDILQVVVEALELFHHSVVSILICWCNNDIHRRLKKLITCNSDSLWYTRKETLRYLSRMIQHWFQIDFHIVALSWVWRHDWSRSYFKIDRRRFSLVGDRLRPQPTHRVPKDQLRKSCTSQHCRLNYIFQN